MLAQSGIDYLAQGNFAAALVPLRDAAAQGDASPATLLNCAIAEDKAGDRDQARRLMRGLVIRLPDWDEPVLRLAESLRAAGEAGEAEAAYRAVLSVNPHRAEAMAALGGLLLLRGEAFEARTLLRRCCIRTPRDAEAWNALGLSQRALGEIDDAVAAFRRAARLQPDRAAFLMNLADATPDPETELDAQIHAAGINPLSPMPHLASAVMLERLGRRTEAIDAMEAASSLAPADITILGLLASLLARSTRAKDAETTLRRLCILTPDEPKPRNDLAAVLMRLHRHAEARDILQDVLERFGPHPSVLCNQANATTCLGRQQDGIALVREAIGLVPNDPFPHKTLCNNLPYLDGVGGEDMLAAMRACSDTLARIEMPPLANGKDPGRRLTIGLLSGNFRSHPVGWMTVAGVENLDPEQFDIVCLAQNASPADPLTRRYKAIAKTWIDVDTLSDFALAQCARNNDIDILIDLGGYGDSGRMPACALRLAPVQVKWVGSQSHSSGLAEMDWFLTDRWETPEGFERFYSERLLRMGDGYIVYSPPPYAPDVNPLPAPRNGYVTFGCFNNLAKITPKVIETWATILNRVPNSILVLKTHQLSDADTAKAFRTAFAARGVDPDRIECRGASGHRAFMGQYGDIDLVLDPFPYSGGLTTCEALWMGVPTITLPGETFASRHSASHMSNAGLSDWLVASLNAYIDMAVSRTEDLQALATLRAGLREQVRTSPLCDGPRFGRNLGNALRHTWQEWCRTIP